MRIAQGEPPILPITFGDKIVRYCPAESSRAKRLSLKADIMADYLKNTRNIPLEGHGTGAGLLVFVRAGREADVQAGLRAYKFQHLPPGIRQLAQWWDKRQNQPPTFEGEPVAIHPMITPLLFKKA